MTKCLIFIQKLLVLFLFCFLTACGETITSSTSVAKTFEFCGEQFKAPNNCEVIGNMIKCKECVFTWTYEPIADLPRHKSELLEELENPKEINVSILKNDLVGYLSKVENYDAISVIGEVNGKGLIVNLWVNNVVKSSADLPEFVRQFITIK